MIIHSVQKIVVLITVRENMDVLAYIGFNAAQVIFYFKAHLFNALIFFSKFLHVKNQAYQ